MVNNSIQTEEEYQKHIAKLKSRRVYAHIYFNFMLLSLAVLITLLNTLPNINPAAISPFTWVFSIIGLIVSYLYYQYIKM